MSSLEWTLIQCYALMKVGANLGAEGRWSEDTGIMLSASQGMT